MRKMLSATVLGVLFGSALLFACLAAPSPALANVFAAGDEMGNPGPLQQQGDIIEIAGDPLRILVFPNGSLQVFHENYAHGATFGEAGSGFFLAVGEAVYGPRGTPFTLLRQEGPFGSGTSGSPFQVVTEGQIRGDGYLLQIVQTVSYVNGDNYFQLQWTITNIGNQRFCFKAYHAADLYFADDDYGLGYYDARSGAVGGFNQSNDLVITNKCASSGAIASRIASS